MTHLTALSVCLTASLLIGSANPIQYMVHSGYFEKNNSGLKGEASYLAIKDRETFDKAFGVAFTMGKKPNVLPVNAFDTRIVVAAIKRGGQVWEYKVEGVTADHATLTVRYGATSKDGSGAQFASPMVVSVARGPYKNVIFIENGKEVGKVSLHEGNDRPKQVWTRVGPLGETPRHVTDAYPLSDQQNKGDWSKLEPMSDEFEGKALDRSKWTVGMSWWKGRQPALFSDKNVTVSDGKLHLTMRKEPVPPQFERLGYHDYTSAALNTRARSSYGYYEVKAKPMNSGGSSSFWFQQDETPGWQTEIDVFEIGGKAKGFESKDNMTVHVFRTPQKKEHWQVGGAWVAPWRLADDYHVYGLDWRKDEITYYVDGVPVQTVENTHWHQPLYLIFDSETMPDWFGMPDDADLPSTFSVEYVRAWKRR